MAPTDRTNDATAIGRADDGASNVNASPQSSRRTEPTSWDALFPTDLLGIAATFLDPESVGNLAVTAGPQISPIVKKAYLKRNLRYLSRNRTNTTIFQAFLEANEDWRGWYDEGAEGGLLSPSDRDLFNSIFNEINVVLRLGQVEVVKHIIEVRGHDVNETKEGASLLRRAVVWGNLRMVEYILGVPELDINARDSVGNGILHFTVVQVSGLNDAMLLLLRHDDIDVDAVNDWGDTPLFLAAVDWAANFGDVGCERAVKQLIEAGADPHAQNNGWTPLGFIEAQGNEEQAALIKEWTRKNRGVKRKAATG